MHMLDSLIEEEKELKIKYYNLINSTKINKGDIRALIGLKTWYYETLFTIKGMDKYLAHISAFRAALEDNNIPYLITHKKIRDEFNSLFDIWNKREKYIKRGDESYSLTSSPISSFSSLKVKKRFNFISLFSGAMGLDLGFMAAGFNLRLANDLSKKSKETIEANLPSLPFIFKDIKEVKSTEILFKANLSRGKVDVLVGGPPCQPFSTAGKRLGFNDPRSSPLKEFIRVIKDIQPNFFVMEEVTGILSSRLRHVPITERNKEITNEEEKRGSLFKTVLEMLESTGYNFTYGILNAADFGAPQIRNRIIFIGSKKNKSKLPEPTHTNSFQDNLFNKKLTPWNSFWDATIDLQKEEDEGEGLLLSKNGIKYMDFIPPGGNWRHLPKELVKEAMGNAYFSGGGKMGFYRRIAWDEPSPTVVTTPIQKGTMLFHPELNRPLNIKEYKRIQGFPDDWKLIGTIAEKYCLIGDAVPVYLSYAIAKEIIKLLE